MRNGRRRNCSYGDEWFASPVPPDPAGTEIKIWHGFVRWYHGGKIYGGMADEQQNTGSSAADGESLDNTNPDASTPTPEAGLPNDDKGSKKKKKGSGVFGKFSV